MDDVKRPYKQQTKFALLSLLAVNVMFSYSSASELWVIRWKLSDSTALNVYILFWDSQHPGEVFCGPQAQLAPSVQSSTTSMISEVDEGLQQTLLLQYTTHAISCQHSYRKPSYTAFHDWCKGCYNNGLSWYPAMSIRFVQVSNRIDN